MKPDANTVARMLAQRIEQLVRELFPAGRREGVEWRVGSLAGEKGQSLAVHLSRARPGVWSDFSAGISGDSLDLVAQALFQGNKGHALTWSRAWLGLGDDTAPPPAMRPAPPPTEDDNDTKRRRTAFAFRVFSEAMPGVADTPVEHYLARRGIVLRELGQQPGALRFHPALPCKEAGRPLPAMVAAVTGPEGKLIAVHRTWLERKGGGWQKASLSAPKKVLGAMSGGSIRLWRGASRKPLAEAPDGETLVIAEGIETSLSIALACPERRVIAAVSIGNMRRLVLPEAVKEIVIAADNDAPDSQAATGLQRAIDHFMSLGCSVKIARSLIGSDFNDALTGGVAT
jgi:hypothetical protein